MYVDTCRQKTLQELGPTVRWNKYAEYVLCYAGAAVDRKHCDESGEIGIFGIFSSFVTIDGF